MFRSVRLKLTMINIAVVGIVLVLFFSSIYLLMRQNIVRQSEQLMFTVAGESVNRTAIHLPQPVRSWANCFYIREDKSGNITEKSSNLPEAGSDETNAFLQEAGEQDNDHGLIKVGGDTFRFLKFHPPGSDGIALVFLNTQPEKETLARLKAVLIFIGLAGLVVVFVSSLFLADRALIPIKKSWERQRNFTADASHELRSPLAVIQTNLELVMGNPDETVESQSKWLENIQAENRRMARLINDLLLLARTDSNQQMMEKRFFPLHKIIGEAVASYEPVAAGKKIGLVFSPEPCGDFFGDEMRIKQLAVILLDNAIKYTPHGGSVRVSLKSYEGNFEMTVADNGEGIAQEHLGRIPERFYRVDKARSRESGGTGLGLSIADWIVKAHRGYISVTSSPGKGSVFKVTLPKTLPGRSYISYT